MNDDPLAFAVVGLLMFLVFLVLTIAVVSTSVKAHRFYITDGPCIAADLRMQGDAILYRHPDPQKVVELLKILQAAQQESRAAAEAQK